MVNSRFRAFLYWIYGKSLGGGMHWAVERDPSILDKRYWERSAIALYQGSSTDYVKGLDRFLYEHRDDLM